MAPWYETDTYKEHHWMVLIKPWFWKAFEIVPEFKLPVEFRTESRHMSSSGPTAIGMPVSLGAYKFLIWVTQMN